MDNKDRPLWKFKQYPLTEKGAIDRWRKKCREYDAYADAEFQTIVNILSSLKKELWTDPEYKQRGFSILPYKKMAAWGDIGELRFTNKAKSPLRVFGFHDDEAKEFIMLGGAVEDNQKYDPAEIRDICVGRKKGIEQGLDIPIDFDFSDEEGEQNDDEYLKALLGLE